MDCARFEELLFEGLDAALAPDVEARILEHAQACGRCRELAALIGGTDDLADGAESAAGAESSDAQATQAPAGLLQGVLSRTSGGSCRRAQVLLAERVDRALGDDGGLLDLHLETCVDCAAVGRALARLHQELPTLAELDPGAAFLGEVMAATAAFATAPDAATMAGGATIASAGATIASAGAMPGGSGTPTGHISLGVHLERFWARIAARPRLAFEGAYAVAFVVFLAFGLPSRSMADLPARAFDGLRQEGLAVERVVSARVDELGGLARTAWNSSTARAAAYLAAPAPGDSPSDRGSRFWAGTARRLAGGLWDGVIVPLMEQFRAFFRSEAQARPENT